MIRIIENDESLINQTYELMKDYPTLCISDELINILISILYAKCKPGELDWVNDFLDDLTKKYKPTNPDEMFDGLDNIYMIINFNPGDRKNVIKELINKINTSKDYRHEELDKGD